jgi:hypothetical protein
MDDYFRRLRFPFNHTSLLPGFLDDLSRIITACLLYYNGDVASVVRFIDGTHIGAHRDWHTTCQVLVAHHVAPSTIQDLERNFRTYFYFGVSQLCQCGELG